MTRNEAPIQTKEELERAVGLLRDAYRKCWDAGRDYHNDMVILDVEMALSESGYRVKIDAKNLTVDVERDF